MKIGPCPQCPESDGWPSKRRPSRWANEFYMRSADDLLMPAKKGQKPPDMKYFREAN
jgi:hypothetical protein